MAMIFYKYSIKTLSVFECTNLLVKHRFFCSQSLSKVDLEIQNERLIKVAVIGIPNAGKSTFINNLIDHRVSC